MATAKFVAPARQVVSLQELMDEELAHKMHENQEPQVAQDEDELDQDLLLALKLSEEEAKANEAFVEDKGSNETPVQEDLDKDYLMALKLQNELVSLQYARHLAEKDRLNLGNAPLAKVSATWDATYQDKYKGHQYYSQEYDGLDPESDDESDEEPQVEDSGKKPHHQAVKTGGRVPAKAIVTKHDLTMDGIKNAEGVERMMDSGNLKHLKISTPVFNALVQDQRKQQGHINKVRGNKVDKSTSEQVMDQRTRVLLLKLLNTELLAEVNGIVNTGKEANVYHAVAGALDEQQTGTEYAVKIFKTTLNEFKNRSDYVEGEFRFRHASLQNPRKLIKLWAEKEMRNLKRLQSADIPCPTPITQKENILVMTFIGKDGWPAPSLKDANLSDDKLRKCYLQTIKLMREMFHKCRLVHADLSEYNILYSKGKVWIIDVSQAVEHDHPEALEFLKKDCQCISTFFSKKGVENCMSTRQLFEFVTDVNLEDKDVDKFVEKTEREIEEKGGEEQTNEDKVAEGVFEKSFIPRTLHQVKHPANELFDGEEDVFHHAVNGLKENLLASSTEEGEDEEEALGDEAEM